MCKIWSKRVIQGNVIYFLANVNSRSRLLYVVVCPSVSLRLSSVVCRLSVTFVLPTQAIQIFDNVSAPFNTLANCRHPGKILRRSFQGNPSVGRVKHKRGSEICRLFLRLGLRLGLAMLSALTASEK